MSIKKLTAGDTTIPASGWNEMRAFVQGYSDNRPLPNTQSNNPWICKLLNNSGENLPEFSVLDITGKAMYSTRSDALFRQGGMEWGCEIKGEVPDDEKNQIAIIQRATRAGEIVDAVADGCTACYIQNPVTNKYGYGWAKPYIDSDGDGETSYLVGSKYPTNITVLWKGGTSTSRGYPCFVRIAQHEYCPMFEGWAESDFTGTDDGPYKVKLARSQKWYDKDNIDEVYSSLLNFNTTVETGTPVIIEYFPNIGKWLIVEAACEPDPDYTPSED